MLTLLVLLLQILVSCLIFGLVLRLLAYALAALGLVIPGDIVRIIGAICGILACIWFLEVLMTHTTRIFF